ncbi:dihydrolipoyl dehydrogenase [Paracoccus sp. JM45]|uniref:dihydrolipoyl dehydrogenase n=1 Tax=Paracoccus sp. JM45 TaxID=2283626 RepID=UPI000E6CE32A|nr:dihydrolipoyl dehydrogenase [Paracoccus sp. JM45]RJE79072.1 dihydrolipoyl dehydrogenase [Paracoccus sp. JM45]
MSNPEGILTCDVAVIGAGTAGLAAERAARDKGARTLLIDSEFRGTLCANTGCMPSKLLIAAAQAAHNITKAPVFGVQSGAVVIDGPAVMKRVRKERDHFVAATKSSFDDLPDGTMIRAKARFISPNELLLDDGRKITAKAIVIATGSTPAIPPTFEGLGDRMLTNETIFELPDLPRSLAVIGGGPIGLELAQAMARLGVKVMLFDQSDTLGKARDPKVGQALKEAVGRDVTFRLGCDTAATMVGEDVCVSWHGTAEGQKVFSHVLVAVGRPPNLDGLALEHSGLALDDHGTPLFNRETMQCGDAPIFIVGDADADAPLLHEASTEGAIAGGNAADFPKVQPGHRSTAFSMIFTDPPHASVGVTPDDAICGCADYSDQGRARAEARAEGCMAIYADPQGRLIGADLCVPGAEHLSHLLVWAVESKCTAMDLLAMPFYHPTLEEGMKSALRQICAAVHQPEPSARDTRCPPGA